MDYLTLQGNVCLQGAINISGAKNAALPLIALLLLSKNPVTLQNLPDVVDIETFFELLKMLGCDVKRQDKHTVRVNVAQLNSTKAT